MWSSKPHEGLPPCSAKQVPSFLSYFKSLSIGPVPGIKFATSSAVRDMPPCFYSPLQDVHCLGIISN